MNPGPQMGGNSPQMGNRMGGQMGNDGMGRGGDRGNMMGNQMGGRDMGGAHVGGGPMGGGNQIRSGGHMGGGQVDMRGQMLPMGYQQPAMYSNSPQGPDANMPQQQRNSNQSGRSFENRLHHRGGGGPEGHE